mgnify:CR=1 FL=1
MFYLNCFFFCLFESMIEKRIFFLQNYVKNYVKNHPQEVEKNCQSNVWKKNADKSYAEIVLICMNQNHFYPSNVTSTSKIWRINAQLIESSIKRLKRSIHFQKSITIFQNIKQQQQQQQQQQPELFEISKYLFFTMRYIIWIWLISKHFEKQIFFFYKVRWRGHKLNARLKKSNCVVT